MSSQIAKIKIPTHTTKHTKVNWHNIVGEAKIQVGFEWLSRKSSFILQSFLGITESTSSYYLFDFHINFIENTIFCIKRELGTAKCFSKRKNRNY